MHLALLSGSGGGRRGRRGGVAAAPRRAVGSRLAGRYGPRRHRAAAGSALLALSARGAGAGPTRAAAPPNRPPSPHGGQSAPRAGPPGGQQPMSPAPAHREPVQERPPSGTGRTGQEARSPRPRRHGPSRPTRSARLRTTGQDSHTIQDHPAPHATGGAPHHARRRTPGAGGAAHRCPGEQQGEPAPLSRCEQTRGAPSWRRRPAPRSRSCPYDSPEAARSPCTYGSNSMS